MQFTGRLFVLCKGRLKSVAVVDQLMAGHLEEMYKDGEDLSTARYRVAALIFHNPGLKSPSMAKMPRVKPSAQPQSDACSMGGCMFDSQACISGKVVPSGVACFDDVCSVSPADRGPPAEMLRHYPSRAQTKGGVSSLHCRVASGGGRRAIQNQGVRRDSGLGSSISCRFRRSLGEIHEDQSEVRQDARVQSRLQGAHQFPGNCHPNSETGQSSSSASLYRFRHGGASHDYSSRLRDLMAVMQRGRWKSLASLKRYQNGARLTQIFSMLPRALQEDAMQSAEDMVSNL